jgi:O-acetyl-ADP-ribose deacetylase (regulator of RNase III)
MNSVAFPAIRTGIYGFPQERAAKIAIREARKLLVKKAHTDTEEACQNLHNSPEHEAALRAHRPVIAKSVTVTDTGNSAVPRSVLAALTVSTAAP